MYHTSHKFIKKQSAHFERAHCNIIMHNEREWFNSMCGNTWFSFCNKRYEVCNFCKMFAPCLKYPQEITTILVNDKFSRTQWGLIHCITNTALTLRTINKLTCLFRTSKLLILVLSLYGYILLQ